MTPDQDDAQTTPPPQTRTVRVRTGDRYQEMELPANVADQWDDELWSRGFPGV